LKLLDADGRAVAAPRDIHLRATASNASVNKSEVIIEKGATSAQVTVSKESPGIADFSVKQVGGVTSAFSGSTQLSFAPDTSVVPKPPFVIAVSISPSSRLRAGLETGTVVARILDAEQREFPAHRTYTIRFPELTGPVHVMPPNLTIQTGESYGTTEVSATQPTVLPFRPSVNPPSTVLSSVDRLEFISPIVSAIAIPQHSYLEAMWPPKIGLAVGLTDGRGNWISSDESKTILLRAEPDNDGIFESSAIQISKGQSVVQSYYTPLREGKVIVKAIAGGLQSPDMTIEFRYTAYFFWIIALVGGLLGGIVKYVLDGERGLRVLLGALVGCFTGWLAYVLVPVLDFRSLSPLIQGASRVFQAFVYGFLGGGIGFAIFKPLLNKVRSAKANP
jgi:hypothetical protein